MNKKKTITNSMKHEYEINYKLKKKKVIENQL